MDAHFTGRTCTLVGNVVPWRKPNKMQISGSAQFASHLDWLYSFLHISFNGILLSFLWPYLSVALRDITG